MPGAGGVKPAKLALEDEFLLPINGSEAANHLSVAGRNEVAGGKAHEVPGAGRIFERQDDVSPLGNAGFNDGGSES